MKRIGGRDMEDKIQNLYQELGEIIVFYLVYQKRDNIERIKKMIPQIQEFVLWFLQENIFGIEAELYQAMSRNLIEILEDILTALEQADMVLMHDAIAYGLMEYLELFVVKPEQGDSADDNI